MKFRSIWLGVLGLLMVQNTVSAQEQIDTTIREQRLEFFQVYKPEIEQPRKKEVEAHLPNLKPTVPVFHYTVPQQMLSYTYNSVPIRPLALGRVEKKIDFQNYAQIGLGNKTSMLFDVGLASIRDKDYEATVHLKHFSQRYNPNQQVDAKTDFAVGGVYHFEEHDVGAKAYYNRHGLRYYGYPQNDFYFEEKDNKQAYSTIGLDVFLNNTAPTLWEINYAPEVQFKHYQDRWDHKERHFNFKAPFSYHLTEQIQLGLNLEGRFASLEVPNWSTWSNVFSITPEFKMFLKHAHFKAAVSNAYGEGGDIYWLPDLYAQFFLFNDGLKLDLGWKSDLLQNSFEELSTLNPFIFGLNQVNQSKADQVFVGFESRLASRLTFGAQLSWRQWSDMPIFFNDYEVSEEGRKFNVHYSSKVQALNPEGFIHYQAGPNFGVKGHVAYTKYNVTEGFDRMYHRPTFKVGGSALVKLFERLTLEGNVDFWNGIYGLDKYGNDEKLNAFLDLQLRGEYTFLDRWSVFLNVNNILNQPYQRWMQYDNYGINFIGGVRFKF